MSEICEISRGVRVVKNQLEEKGQYPVYQNCMTPLGYFNKKNCNAGTTFVIVGGAAGQVGYSDVDFWAADDCLYFNCSEQLHGKFLYHLLLCKQEYLKSQVRKASVPRLSRSVVEKIKIPIPPIEEQNRIVAILDKFDALVNDISIGLPAEIKMRRQQYEYYRNKLLRFNEI
jgi:type I restriction enzyme S subunit